MSEETETNNEPEFSTRSAVGYALNGQPLEFENQIKGLLADRVANAIEVKREHIGRLTFGPPPEDIPQYTEVDPATGKSLETSSEAVETEKLETTPEE